MAACRATIEWNTPRLCQSALKIFQGTASKSFQLAGLVWVAVCGVRIGVVSRVRIREAV